MTNKYPTPELSSEQRAQFERDVAEHLSSRGIKIVSSKTFPNGGTVHEGSVRPGAMILSRPTAAPAPEGE